MTLAAKLTALATAVGVDIKALITTRGNLAALTTTEKTTLVGAINEIKAAVASASGINDAASSSTSSYSSSKVIDLLTTLENKLTGGASSALDTLGEIEARLGTDQTALGNLLTAVGNRVRFDDVQSLTAPQQAQARANIGAASAADTGDAAGADPVAAYTAAKA
ncbi:hypothetical protein [Deinococcus sp. QL22]|uniref:hypothetical protein n=1 Tax=Deinococcus sp. QL22 TaxID=2939437 RepID=UPI0020174D62|nr:hypothetical protein [Deinococcus sp. QL22]UQN10343.1 hypothetical protein M1R55_29775 [Deinococcus sp. QL22]UQN10477.1 hypothetical protein M1R55_29100 [Deinococcus sp. QL22]